MKDVMIDIETLGRSAGCVILSIGAVTFDPFKCVPIDEFYVNIDEKLMFACGFHSDQDTVDWWEKQSDEAKEALKTDKRNPLEALENFRKFLIDTNCVKAWSQGAAFDFPILEKALSVFSMQAPWKFWNVRDTRTAYDICGFDPRKVSRNGTYHSALDDCKHQIKCLGAALNVYSKTHN